MRIYLTTLTLSVALAVSAEAAIDFTPTGGERTLEGVVFKQIILHQDGHVITYEQPQGWSYSGDAAGMRLTPANVSQAQVTIQQTALPGPQAFDGPTVKQLQQVALSSVPDGALNVVLLAEEKNPLQIHQQETYGVTITYNYFGQDYGLNLLFVNLGNTQVRFRMVARKADFEQVRREFRGSLFSLAWN